MYRLLARLWLREADTELLGELRAPPLCDCFLQAGGVLPTKDGAPDIQQLAVDYCQLFVGPMGHLPPVQSVWQAGQFQSSLTSSMQHFIDILRYPTDELPGGMMLDHLGVQLDVMAYALDQIARRATEIGELLAVVNLFSSRHLIWPSKLLAAAEDRAETPFYCSIVTMTRDFLNSETAA